MKKQTHFEIVKENLQALSLLIAMKVLSFYSRVKNALTNLKDMVK